MARDFPFYQQLDAMDCGATCLRMVARHFGKYYSLDHLRELTYIGKQGVNLLGISDAAEHIGLQSLAVQTDFERIPKDIPLPCIAHWQQDHFVVVYKATSTHVWIADPREGKFKITKEQFISNWASDVEDDSAIGVLLLLETTPQFYANEGQEQEKGGIAYLWSYVKQYKGLLGQIALGLAVGSGIQLLFPFLLKSMIDVGIFKGDISFVGLIVIAQLILFITYLAVTSLRRWTVVHIGVRININLISDFLIKLTRLPIKFFDSKLTGDLMERIADHERVQRFLTSVGLVSIFSIFNIIAFSLVLYLWSKTIFLIFLMGTAIHFAWVFFTQKWRRGLEYKRFDQSVEVQAQLLELINGMQDVKLFNAEKYKRWEWERTQASMYRTSLASLNIEQWQQIGARFLNESKNLLITFVVVNAVIRGEMTIGMLVAIHYIMGQLNEPIHQFVSFFSDLQEVKISLERMNEIHTKKEDDNPSQKITILPEAGDLRFENVSFQYDGSQSKKILNRISFTIPKGETTAIVGASGSGKTTLLKLLLNIYEPSEGAVRVGDLKISNLHGKLWREHCGAVLQDATIFNETIAKNIALGDDKVDQRKLLRAVKVANIQHFIESLPIGYNTKLGSEGLGLSQGQKQRLLIARLVYKNPDYIFLDEATSSLDSFNELVVMEELGDFFANKTVVIVAHRLSTVKNADNIIVLDSGEVVEQGNHEELTYVRGTYYQLVRNQLELGG